MPVEIEHKFLLRALPAHTGEWPHKVIRQGYLSYDPLDTKRIRIEDDVAIFTRKTKAEHAVYPDEDEHVISMEEALAHLQSIDPQHIVEKKRYESSEQDGHLWQIDVFTGRLEGLVIAEIELLSDTAKYIKPIWLGDAVNVTHDARFKNAVLAKTSREDVMKSVRAVLNGAQPAGYVPQSP